MESQKIPLIPAKAGTQAFAGWTQQLRTSPHLHLETADIQNLGPAFAGMSGFKRCAPLAAFQKTLKTTAVSLSGRWYEDALKAWRDQHGLGSAELSAVLPFGRMVMIRSGGGTLC